uniref:Uncharacterized protein n=1 Tax=Lactuca sativa TaxID=4236 RepID=A0A9R1VP83_LACSA|nr:hypothetical protein LSAT_V11C500279990 [Lactuca sativa]
MNFHSNLTLLHIAPFQIRSSFHRLRHLHRPTPPTPPAPPSHSRTPTPLQDLQMLRSRFISSHTFPGVGEAGGETTVEIRSQTQDNGGFGN